MNNISAIRERISIHSPRVGRGKARASRPSSTMKFQSTRPGWGEANGRSGQPSTTIFQSTRPGWGEAFRQMVVSENSEISIHSPRVGRGVCEHVKGRVCGQFQSTRPGWGEACA